jgi:hypothetical protein
VTFEPPVTVLGDADTVVVVAIPLTVKVVDPCELANVVSPE